MEQDLNTLKSKRLQFIRILMYLDALLILLSLLRIDIRYFSFSTHCGLCMRILILVAVFGFLLLTEKGLSRYLRKNQK